MSFAQGHGGWEFSLPHTAGTSSSIISGTGQGITAYTCELNDVFPPDDLRSGQKAQFISTRHMSYYECILIPWNELLLKDINTNFYQYIWHLTPLTAHTLFHIPKKACEGIPTDIGPFLWSLLADGPHVYLWW